MSGLVHRFIMLKSLRRCACVFVVLVTMTDANFRLVEDVVHWTVRRYGHIVKGDGARCLVMFSVVVCH